MTEKQEDVQGGVKTEGSSSNDGIEGNCYEQNGKFGIGEMSGGEIKNGAKVAGNIYESPSNNGEINHSLTQQGNITNNFYNAKEDTAHSSSLSKPLRDGEEKSSKKRAFATAGTFESVDEGKLKAILGLLRKVSEDISIEIVDIEEGSIRLILQGSQEGLERLEALFKLGELSEVLDIPVEDVRFIEPKISENSEDTTTNERKRLAFTIAGNIDEADLAKLKAAVVENSNSSEEIKTDPKSRLIQEIITKGGFRRNLNSADLSGANLGGANLSGANLSDANLSDANLTEANLIIANMRGANLRRADLRRADLRRTNLSGADLSGADLSDADLIGANLSGAIINTETKIDKQWRLLWETSNKEAEPINLSRRNSNFPINGHISNFMTGVMIGGNFEGNFKIVHNQTNSSEIEDDTSLSDIQQTDTQTKADNKRLLISEILNKEAEARDLSGADLSDANLTGANLIAADLRNADLTGADLTGANLSDAKLIIANLSNANLSNADLRRADLRRANLSNTNLSDANVKNAQFGSNLGISEPMKQDLIKRGAIFL